MKLSTILSMPATCRAFDYETHLIRLGLLAPRAVCAAVAALAADGTFEGVLLDRRQGTEALAALLDDPTAVIAMANASFDLLVGAIELALLGVDAMPAIFAALMDHQRVFDILTTEMLDAVAEGCLGKDPRSGGPITSPETGKRAGYNLEVVTDFVLDRQNAKANDEFRLKYGELDGTPIELWPPQARTYPVDDGVNTAEDALAQAGHVPRAGAHRWGPQVHCEWCGCHPKDAYVDGKYVPCRATRRSRNIHDLGNQVATAWAMHLGASWGFLTDQTAADAIERAWLDGRVEHEQPFVDIGLLRRNSDGTCSRDMAAIYRRIALAYGADEAKLCVVCRGTSKVVSPKAKPVRCPTCRAVAKPLGSPPCHTCGGALAIPNPRQLVNCTSCGATGLDLTVAPNMPKTDTGRVGTKRDVLNESGDEVLIDLADHLEGEKIGKTYLPWLRLGRAPIAGHGPECPSRNEDACDCPGPYRAVPLTLWPNVLLETGRTSYRGVVQLLPRRPGHWKTYVTIDEVPADYVLQPGEVFV